MEWSGSYLLILNGLLQVLIQFVFAELSAENVVIESDGPFRMSKINYVWRKAIRHIRDDSHQKRLMKELEKYDEMYRIIKTNEVKNEKLNNEQVDRKLEAVLEKYNLSGAVKAFNEKMKWRSDHDRKIQKEEPEHHSVNFSNPRSQKLWNMLTASSLSADRLRDLSNEIQKYEEKVAEYDAEIVKFNDILQSNRIEKVGESDKKSTPSSSDLKKHFAELEKSYENLYAKVKRAIEGRFQNEKVQKLWEMTMDNQRISPNELKEIEIELRHLDRQLMKLKFHEEERMASNKVLEDMGKSGVYSESMKEFEEENERLRRKMRRLEKSLTSRISVHTEL
ncbi:hypothetical protein AB6A40_000169 [Gnathostoma spinigerum]|uniref:Alpha-2-macroglobulin receptor-associated protein n=1 Tax=Gnathostoma spinigerum TaxID=75299 RepID=A0ABD6E1J4_9BILA